MALSRVMRRTVWCAVALVSIGSGTLAMSPAPASAVDADVYIVAGLVTPATTVSVPGLTTTYSVGAACKTEGSVSTYVDLSRSETGGCSVGGSPAGSLTLTGCSTGAIAATSWQLKEPSNESATFTGSGVVVGGVTLIAGSPLHGSGNGYWDPSTSITPGTAVVVGVLTPLVGQTCVTGVSSFDFASTLVGEY
jgi:hypothetical protein